MLTIPSKILLQKLWGIGSKTAKALYKRRIRNIDDVAQMDVQSIYRQVGRPSSELTISKFIAQTLGPEFIKQATISVLPLAKEVKGIGLDLGLFLYAHDIRTIKDRFLFVKLANKNLPNRLLAQLNQAASNQMDVIITDIRHTAPIAFAQPHDYLPEVKSWDGLQFRFPPHTRYAHPDREHYDIDTSKNWTKAGTDLIHLQINEEISKIITETTATKTIFQKIGKLLAGPIGTLLGQLLSVFVSVYTQQYWLDEKKCVWVWISKAFLKWYIDNYVELSLMPEQIALTTMGLAWARIGYLQIGSVNYFDNIQKGVVGGGIRERPKPEDPWPDDHFHDPCPNCGVILPLKAPYLIECRECRELMACWYCRHCMNCGYSPGPPEIPPPADWPDSEVIPDACPHCSHPLPRMEPFLIQCLNPQCEAIQACWYCRVCLACGYDPGPPIPYIDIHPPPADEEEYPPPPYFVPPGESPPDFSAPPPSLDLPVLGNIHYRICRICGAPSHYSLSTCWNCRTRLHYLTIDV